MDEYKIKRFAKYPRESGWDGAHTITVGTLLALGGRYEEYKNYIDGETPLKKQSTEYDRVRAAIVVEELADFRYYPRPTTHEFMLCDMVKKWYSFVHPNGQEHLGECSSIKFRDFQVQVDVDTFTIPLASSPVSRHKVQPLLLPL